MYGRSNAVNSDVFATPKARSRTKARSRVPPTIREDIKDNFHDEGKSKLDFKQKSVEFATPKVSNAKPKIIHKEKLSSFNLGVMGRSNGSVPTAQVFPSPVCPTSTHASSLSSMTFPSKNTKWDSDTSLSTTLTDTTVLQQANGINTRHGHSGSLVQDDEFEELMASNMTLDSTQLFSDNHKQHGKYSTMRSNPSDLNSNLDELTRSASALNLGSHTITNVSEPSLHPYNSEYAGTGLHSSLARSQDMYRRQLQEKYQTQPSQPGSYGQDSMPSFQAASFGNSGLGGVGGTYTNHNSYMGHSLPPSAFSRQPGDFPGYNPGSSSLNFTSDLSNWQQKHQHQLQMQQMEAHQSGALNGGILTPAPVSTILPSNDPTRLDAVKKAADNIISEKDNIIDRQKLKIMEMERQTRETEVDMHRALLRKVHDDGETLNLKLQEAHYENASVKAHLTEVMSARSKDLEELEKKLGASEYELLELKGSLNKEVTTKNRELKELENKLQEQDSIVKDYKEKYGCLKKSNGELEMKVLSLERYITDLPTANDHKQSHSKIHTLKEEKMKYEQLYQGLKKKVKEMTKSLVSSDGLIEDLKHNEKDLKERVEQLQNERDSLAEEVCQLRHGGASIPEEDFAELEEENMKLKAEFDNAKMLMDTQYKKQQQAEGRHRQELMQLEERLAQDEDSVTALRQELAQKDEHLRKLRQSVKELGSQNQDMMEQNIILRDKVKEFEAQHTGEANKLEKRLMKELAICFAELQSLVQICVQRAEGQDPNISVLLGIRATSVSEFDVSEQQGDNVQSLKFKLAKVKELRNEVDKMRELLSNKYAEEMGENLNCTTQ